MIFANMRTKPFELNTPNVRDHNLSEVVQLIHRSGAMSRADISRETGLSATTVSALANVLIDSGLVSEAGEAESRGGRPPILMQFKYTARYAIGEIPRPAYWSGFRVAPQEIEFWSDGTFRLHDRIKFVRNGEGWDKTRLYP